MAIKVAIFGSGDQARVIHNILQESRQYEVGCFYSLEPGQETLYGVPSIKQEPDFSNLEFDHGIIAIGDNFLRRKLAEEILAHKQGFTFINAIHPSAIISTTASIGHGNAIMTGAIICNEAKIENHSIINTGAKVDHDCLISSYTSIGPGVTLGGRCRVDSLTAVCIGSTVLNNISMGANALIGAGSVVTRNLEEGYMYYGTPAKPIRKREEGEKYL